MKFFSHECNLMNTLVFISNTNIAFSDEMSLSTNGVDAQSNRCCQRASGRIVKLSSEPAVSHGLS